MNGDDIRGFKKLNFHHEKPSEKCTPTKMYFKSPTSFRQISESKEKKPMFGKLRARKIQESQTCSDKKPVNLFSKLIESRQHSTSKKLNFMEETKVSANDNSLSTNNGSIIKQCNKENRQPQGLKFKGFPHKKLKKITSQGPLNFASKSPKAVSKKRLIQEGPLIGSNKKNKNMMREIPETDRSKYNYQRSEISIGMTKYREQTSSQLTDRLIDTISIAGSMQNSVVRSQSSLLFDMSPTLV